MIFAMADIPNHLAALGATFIVAVVVVVITLCITYAEIEKQRIKHRDRD